MDEDGRPNPFRDNKPGKDWLRGFFGRHSELSLRTTLQLGKERAVISPDKIKRWFGDLEQFLDSEVKDQNLLLDPSRIYNADESGFSLCPKSNQVIGYKGAPVVYNFSTSDKTQITVMAAVSATGHYIPPMLVYPGQRFTYNPLEGFEEAAMGRSDSGWMDSELFCNWLTTVFIPAVNARSVQRPILLFIDGHSTHVTLEASDICIQNGIVMYCLLEHASHMLQHLDLKLFSSLKETWRQSVRDWQAEHIGDFVTKRTFASVFKQAWQRSATTDIAVKGFRDAGLFPLDPGAVLGSVKIEPSKIFHTYALEGQLQETKCSPPSELAIVPANVELTDEQSAPLSPVEASAAASVSSDTQQSSSTETSCVSSPLSAQPQALLAEFESFLSKDKLQLYNQWFKLNTSDSDDGVYDVWFKMKALAVQASLTTTEPSASLTFADSSKKDDPPKTVDKTDSPFSKFLKMPEATASKKPCKKRLAMPKAITGSAFRKILTERKLQKEQLEEEKKKRKEERLNKKKEKEEEKEKKKMEKEAKKAMKLKTEERKGKIKVFQSLIRNSISDESDDALEVVAGKCYECERPYGDTGYIQCSHCDRIFHVTCVQKELEYVTDALPFECKYC
ncbi:MAG: hypothetical protein AB2693_29655 [Candidatus Thiodiazotropha sp.]